MGKFKGKAAKASDIKPGGKSARGPATSGAPGGKKKK
jgi:hypothetical protein